jgi:prepilin-type N-terminal cleavage/methylation domain-containing protein
MNRSTVSNTKNGFALIELLIVVAIIAILAAIAIPNFLSAQTRSKVSRVKSEMRSLTTAIESYHVDNTAYPPYGVPPDDPAAYDMWAVESRLTTPISYIRSIPLDVFHYTNSMDGSRILTPYVYVESDAGFPDEADPMNPDLWHYELKWFLMSNGPDLDNDHEGDIACPNQYDPTNGTISDGDIYRYGP